MTHQHVIDYFVRIKTWDSSFVEFVIGTRGVEFMRAIDCEYDRTFNVGEDWSVNYIKLVGDEFHMQWKAARLMLG